MTVWAPIAAHPRSNYDPVAALDAWLDIAGAAQTAAGVGPGSGSPVWLPITKGGTITRHKSIRMMRHYDKRAGWWQRNPTTSIEL